MLNSEQQLTAAEKQARYAESRRKVREAVQGYYETRYGVGLVKGR